MKKLILISSLFAFNAWAAPTKIEVVLCKHISGTAFAKTVELTYTLNDRLAQEEVGIKLSNNIVGVKNKLKGNIWRSVQHEGLEVMHQKVYTEPSGVDYDALAISFFNDENLRDGKYATVHYYSDGPSYVGFYKCQLKK